MYVCKEVVLRGIAHGRGRSNWAKERDPSGSWVQYPQPRGHHWSRVMHADMLSHTIVCFPYQLYSRRLRVTCILTYRGAVSHRARNALLYLSVKVISTLLLHASQTITHNVHIYFPKQPILIWQVEITV